MGWGVMRWVPSKPGAAGAKQGNGGHHQGSDGHAFAARLLGQADAGEHGCGCDEQEGAQQLVLIPAVGVEQRQQRYGAADQGGNGQPQGAGQWGIWPVVGSRWLSVVAGRLHGSALRAAQGGFVDLVSAGSAVRHGVFPVGSGERRWTGCFG